MGIYRFPPFEFDSATLRLRKHALRVRLQRKPALVLAALLENQQEPVTRKELYARLWPADTFVEFDQSLNVAIKKLRDSLGDSTEDPRFIETVAGHGYRFIGEVEAGNERGARDDREAGDKSDRRDPGVEREQSAHGNSVLAARPQPVVVARGSLLSSLRFVAGALSVMGVLGTVYLLVAFSNAPPIFRAANFRQVTRSGTEKTPFTTDGERIYFFELRGDKTFLTQLSVNGGEELRIPASANMLPYQADVLGDKIVYLDGKWDDYFKPEAGAQVWVRHLPAGTPWQLPGTRCQSVSWTRDRHILCALGGEFRIIDLQGKVIRKLFNVGDSAFRAHLSPDEKRIRFDMARGEGLSRNVGIWEVGIDGANLHRLGPPGGISCCGSWSSDGSLYVFTVSNADRRSDIWGLPESNGLFSRSAEPVRLTSGPLDARYPKASADGREVFFMGADFRGELSTVDENSGQLVPYLTGDSITQVEFSPDRKWMTYVAYPEGSLWRSRPDGSDRLQLTRAPLLAYSPQFSRDGRWIFFSDISAGDKFYSVSMDGGTLMPLFKAGPECVARRDILLDSPFLTWCPVANGRKELRLVDPSAGASTRISECEGLEYAVLSPNGDAIAGFDPSSGKLKIFQIKNRRWIEIPIPVKDNPGSLVWSPAGDSVYLRQDETILRCRLKTARAEVVIRLPKSSSYLWWSNWFGINPNGKLMLTRQVGAGDIYAFQVHKN